MPETREQQSSLDESLSTVELTEAEIAFLSSDEIGQLAGREPRTVKRFINVYRLIRARLTTAEREIFLGNRTEAEQYPVVAVLIAIETGLSSETVAEFYSELKRLTAADLSSIANKTIATAFAAASTHRGQRTITGEECLAWAGLVRRYSFNREP